MMVSALIERELAGAGKPVRDGVFVAVVGPSGAGKDTLIAYARAALAGDGTVEFARRVITRPSDASSEDRVTRVSIFHTWLMRSAVFALTLELK